MVGVPLRESVALFDVARSKHLSVQDRSGQIQAVWPNQAFLKDVIRPHAQVVLYGKDVDMSQVLLQAKRFPMMSDRSVVLVKEAQSILEMEKEAVQAAELCLRLV